MIGTVDIRAARASLERPYRGRLPAEIRIVPEGRLPEGRSPEGRPADGGVAGEWVVSTQAAADAPVLLYLHGGGFFACSPETHRPVTMGFARGGMLRVFALRYRRAPEHRFPAAIEDAVACCDWIEATTGRPVAAIAGDSAGGALALSTLLRLRDSGRTMPRACVAFSPVTDLAATGDSVITNDRKDALFFGASIARLPEVYLPGDVSPRDPLASPLYAALDGLPPLLLHVGADEVLRDDTLRFAAKARAAGVAVSLRVWPVVPHAWQLMGGVMPEGVESVAEARGFVAGLAAGAG